MSKGNDILKSLGIRVGEPTSLIEHVQTEVKDFDLNQPIRKGFGYNAADALNEQLSKGGISLPSPKIVRMSPHAEDKRTDDKEKEMKEKAKADADFSKKKRTDHEGSLKNTHGENWHDDNDKQVEDLVSSSEEIDREFNGEDDSDRPAKTNTRLYQRNAGGEKNYAYEFKSMTQEELFLKGIEKSRRPMPSAKPSKVAPRQKKDPAQAKMERQVRRELGFNKSVEDSIDSLIQMGEDPYAGQEEFIANVHENSEGVAEKKVVKGEAASKKISKLVREEGMPQKQAVATALNMEREGRLTPGGGYKRVAKKSELDEVLDLIKGQGPTLGAKEGRVPVMREHGGKPSGKPAPSAPASTMSQYKSKKCFVKAMGVGGVVFDFGHKTGNEIADRASDLLNAHGDPVQVSNAQYQKKSFGEALESYAQKGELHSQEATPFGNIDKGWNDQLNTSMDQQVMNLYKQEQESKDPSVPAVKNQFNDTTLNVGGDVVKATSETDAAVLEMYRSQMESLSDPNAVTVDASTGGAQRVEIEI